MIPRKQKNTEANKTLLLSIGPTHEGIKNYCQSSLTALDTPKLNCVSTISILWLEAGTLQKLVCGNHASAPKGSAGDARSHSSQEALGTLLCQQLLCNRPERRLLPTPLSTCYLQPSLHNIQWICQNGRRAAG